MSRQTEEIISVIYHQEIEICVIWRRHFFVIWLLTNQHVHHSWQMKKQLLGISISFYLRKCINYSCCSIILLWDWQISRGFPYLNYAYIKQHLQRSLWSIIVQTSGVFSIYYHWSSMTEDYFNYYNTVHQLNQLYHWVFVVQWKSCGWEVNPSGTTSISFYLVSPYTLFENSSRL